LPVIFKRKEIKGKCPQKVQKLALAGKNFKLVKLLCSSFKEEDGCSKATNEESPKKNWNPWGQKQSFST
jgi:hypothetical protein